MTLAYRDPTIPDSPPARWDPRWKLAAMLVFAFGVAILREPVPLLVALVLTFVLLAMARLPIRSVAGRIGTLLLAILPFVVVLPVFVENGGQLATTIALRCVTIGSIALFLAHTAPLPRTLAAAHALGVPGPLVHISQLAHRYMQILFAEARRIRIAMRTRGFRIRTNAHTYRSLGHLAGALVVSGHERSERVAAAMKCRGFDGTMRSATPFRSTANDRLATLALLAVTIALIAWERWT